MIPYFFHFSLFQQMKFFFIKFLFLFKFKNSNFHNINLFHLFNYFSFYEFHLLYFYGTTIPIP